MNRNGNWRLLSWCTWAGLGVWLGTISCQNGVIDNSKPRSDAGPDGAALGSGGNAALQGTGGMGAVSNPNGGGPVTGQAGADAGRDPGAGTGGSAGSNVVVGTGGSTGRDASVGGNAGRDAALGTGGSSSSDGSVAGLANPAPGSKFFVGVNFWNIDWEGQEDYFATGVDFANTTNPWRPELLEDLAPFHVIRFMDWNLSGESSIQADWSTRRKKTDAQSQPVAFEWQIDLCNRAKKDYWVTVPHLATEDYWTKLAQLIHDQLDPSLRVYVEWSNEVWNGSPNYPAHDYAAAQASQLSLPGDEPSASYYVYISLRLFESFESVFGKGSPRVVKVLAGQAAWTHWCEAHTVALADAKINPRGLKPDVYAVAPYCAGKTIEEMTAYVANTTQWTKDHAACAKTMGVPLISYEGGGDSFELGDGCASLQTDPGQYDLYRAYLDGIAGAGMTGPFMHYTHTGDCWGLKKRTGDPVSSSPRYKAVIDWLADHR